MGLAKKLTKKGKPSPVEAAKEAARAEANGYMCCLVMAWLHIRRGYGEKRIREAFESFVRFFQDLEQAETTTGDLIEVLRDECGGFDMEMEFARLERRIAVENAQWERKAREQEARLCKKS